MDGLLRIAALLFLTFSPAHAVEPTDELASCFGDPRPVYLEALAHSGFTAKELKAVLHDSCSDLRQTQVHGKKKLRYRMLDAFERATAESLLQAIPTMFTDVLDRSQVLKDYEARLAEIAKIKDRYVRIRKTYELAIASQGAYDNTRKFKIMVPGNVLKPAKRGKPGGVCRDFAHLLVWSLMHVYRSPESNTFGGLDEDSFLPKFVADVQAGHAWVDVLLPVGLGDEQVFHRMSLDSTYYDSNYAPLFARRQGLPKAELERKHAECVAVLDCVRKAVR
jgi:hypothetical protein